MMKYKSYIESNEWLNKSSNYLKNHEYCEVCRKWKAKQVHHLSYNRIGEEKESDLQALCERCHIAIHNMPPNIPDPEQLKKALKIMKYFNKYPRIKTIVLNDISKEFYNEQFMISLMSEIADETPLFVQNLLEFLYEDGIALGFDIIEKTYASCIKYKIQASKNAKKRRKEMADRTRKYESGELKYINIEYTTTIKIDKSKKQIIEAKIQEFCLSMLNDKVILKNAKSYMNKNFYKGLVYFNKENASTSAQFYLRIKNDGLTKELFQALGGNVEVLISEVEDG